MELIEHGHACVVLCEGDRRLVIDPGFFTQVDALAGASSVLVTPARSSIQGTRSPSRTSR